MKRLTIILAVVAGFFFTTEAQVAQVDKQAPDFTIQDTEGKTHTLSDFKGKHVVLEWVNYGCPFVKKHYNSGNMQKLQKTFTDKGIVWLSVCSSAEGKQGYFDNVKIKELKTEKKAAYSAYLVDEEGTVGKMYGAKTTPHMYVIDPEGVLIYAGAIDDKPSTNVEDVKDAKNYVVEALKASMDGEEVETKSTSAYGCGVKYK